MKSAACQQGTANGKSVPAHTSAPCFQPLAFVLSPLPHCFPHTFLSHPHLLRQVRSPLEPLASFWMCAPDQHSENLHVKSIVQPARVAGVTTDPHHLKYVEPYFAVNTTHDRVDGPKSERQASDRLALYHYALKSEEEYQAKMKRGSGELVGLKVYFLLVCVVGRHVGLLYDRLCTGTAAPR